MSKLFLSLIPTIVSVVLGVIKNMDVELILQTSILSTCVMILWRIYDETN